MGCPRLNKTYCGRALRIRDGNVAYERPEQIAGSFRIVKIHRDSAVIGNGEEPEDQWFILDRHTLGRI